MEVEACSLLGLIGLGTVISRFLLAALAAPPMVAFGIAAVPGHAIPLVATAMLGAAGKVLLAAVGRWRRQ
ncbi:MAG: hypothetical protein H7345_13025 [Rubritepida sp.]|nr:hypothetical protein [Rubritepida sp.]